MANPQAGIFSPSDYGAVTDRAGLIREQLIGAASDVNRSANLATSGVAGQIRTTYYAAAASASASNILALTGLNAAAQPGFTTGISQPDVPRIARIVAAKSGMTAVTGNVTVHGTDVNGNSISDTIALNDTTAVNGVKAFKTITSIDLPARVNASGDQVSVGGGAALGLQDTLQNNTVFAAFVNGAQEATAPTVATDSADVSKNVVTTNTATAGHKVVILYVAEYAS